MSGTTNATAARMKYVKRQLACGNLSLAVGFARRYGAHFSPSAQAYFWRRGGVHGLFAELMGWERR